jgi:conjugative relaxase-like TrwC/TraI family protein
VLTIGKLGTSRGRLEYYDAQVAAGVEDYYTGRGESPGRWRGSGARALGLTRRERVRRCEFMALMGGRSPGDGAVLRSVGARSTVSGFDLTFSAPKSVSLLFAVCDDRVAGELLASHEEAVDAALGYLEREACFTRRGRDGVERLNGEGFVAASYRHRMSRAGDPQLHTHVVVANVTRAEGRYTALDGRGLYEHKSAGGAVYRAVLRARVRERLGWASWHSAGRGLFELDGVPAAVLRHFSTRRVEIEERAVELAGAGPGGLSRERMQAIALSTRRAKTYGVDGAGWREQARARAAEHGLGQAELAALLRRRPGEAPALDFARVSRRLSGPEGLTARHNTFARRHALAELAGAFSQGATLEDLEAVTSSYLTDSSVARLTLTDRGESRYTTHDLLALERDLIERAERRSTESTAVLPGLLVDRVLGEHQPALNHDQAHAVRQIASSGRGVETVTALAGTGKTTMIGALAYAYQQAGWRVVGAAPTARAARQMREMTGIQADTMHALLGRLHRVGGLNAQTVLVLDETGMAPTRHSAALLSHAELVGAKVIAIGDPGQLPSVDAGGWLAALARSQQAPVLRQVMRQRDPGEQQTLAALHDGDPDPYLAYKHEAITVHDAETQALLQVRDEWHNAQRLHGLRAAVMITRDNLTRERLNRAARVTLKRDGVLDDVGIHIGGREYSPGDRIVARRNDRSNDVDNGTLATILAVDQDTRSILIQTDTGQARRLKHDYMAEHVEHAYALTGHAAQGATVTWAVVVGRPSEFTREWAYTVLSRAREQTLIHLISEPSEPDRERETYAPTEPRPEPTQALAALQLAMKRTQTERLALEYGRASGTANPEAHHCHPSSQRTPELIGLRSLQRTTRPANDRLRL